MSIFPDEIELELLYLDQLKNVSEKTRLIIQLFELTSFDDLDQHKDLAISVVLYTFKRLWDTKGRFMGFYLYIVNSIHIDEYQFVDYLIEIYRRGFIDVIPVLNFFACFRLDESRYLNLTVEHLTNFLKMCDIDENRRIIQFFEGGTLEHGSALKRVKKVMMNHYGAAFEEAVEPDDILKKLCEFEVFAEVDDIIELLLPRIYYIMAEDEMFSLRIAMTLAMCGFDRNNKNQSNRMEVIFPIIRFLYKHIQDPYNYDIGKVELAVQLFKNFVDSRIEVFPGIFQPIPIFPDQLTIIYDDLESKMGSSQSTYQAKCIAMLRYKLVDIIRGDNKFPIRMGASFGDAKEIARPERIHYLLECSRNGMLSEDLSYLDEQYVRF
ncbi:unnamed protein product [Caenorhabditis angaria]|uniref:Uncharacterized protein n=1 Tax=Caenorhabditis angaria TaxID=860376 RepID=A0A9P1N320_9PELO|nr:unnamed protein product [Caenorhabditis angaria]